MARGTLPAMNHGSFIGKVDAARPCWTCEHFVALTEGGSAFCVHGAELRACAQAAGCAFHRPAPQAPAERPQPVSFCDAWRRVPRSIPRPPEVMVDGDTGFLVPPRDHEAMAEKIVLLLKDDKLRPRLGRAAFERALEHFTVDRMVEGTIALYERLLAGRPVTT